MEDVSEQAAGGPIGQGLVEAVSASRNSIQEENKDELDFVAVRDESNTSNILSRVRSATINDEDLNQDDRKQSGRF